MGILDRLIFREVAFATLAAIGVFVFVMLTGTALRDVVGLVAAGNVSALITLKLLLLLLPYVGAYALPLGVLTGVLIAYGRLSGNQEITAMQAAGLGLRRLAAPALLVALAGSAVVWGVNYWYGPLARTAYKQQLALVVRDNPVTFLQPRTFIKDFDGVVLYIGDRAGNELRDFWIWQLDDAGRAEILIRAREGRFAYDRAEEVLTLTLLNGTGERRPADDPEALGDPDMPTLFFEELPIRLPLSRILERAEVPTKLDYRTLPQLWADWQQAEAAQADPDPDVAAEALQRKVAVQMQIQRNASMGMGVLSLTLLGIPLAIRVGRRETYANVALALGIGLVFMLMIVVGETLADRPAWRPDLLVWLPNLLCQGAALGLFLRAERR
ncbi:MAG: LptF/LptG family permease [Opitutales bacterium]